MAIKALIFGTDDLYLNLKNFYDLEVQRGNLEIVAYADLDSSGKIVMRNSENNLGGGKFSDSYHFLRK